MLVALRQSETASPADGALLQRFLAEKDDAAFGQLMKRHGAMLFGMARRMTSSTADAEDVCQAAFLLLARKAPELVVRSSLAGWLVNVVRRLAADLRKMSARRSRHEQASAVQSSTDVEPSLLLMNREVSQQMDAALATLPAIYREPLLLCFWQGLSKPEATARLGWKAGTLSGRLARAKTMLQQKLERQGVLPAVTLAWLSGAGLSQALPTLPTAESMRCWSANASQLPPRVSTLVQGAWQTMQLRKWIGNAAVIALMGVTALMGLGAISYLSAQEAAKPSATVSPVKPTEGDHAKLQGRWNCVAVVMGGRTPEDARKNPEQMRSSTWFAFDEEGIRIGGSPSESKPIKYTLKTDVTPRQLHLEAGVLNLHGIYSVQEGILLLRFAGNSSEPDKMPKSFSLDDKSDGVLFVLQKEKLSHLQSDAPPVNLGERAVPTMIGLAHVNCTKLAAAAKQYQKEHNHFPTNVYDASGKAILSWRVKLLPYLGARELYQKFKLNEAWDSPHNKKLLEEMPEEFRYTIPGKPLRIDGKTPFRAFAGKGTLHESGKQINTIADEENFTFLFVEAAEAVEWTKPDDLAYDPKQPLPKLGGRINNLFLAAFCDGGVRVYEVPTTSEEQVRFFRMITPSGGEKIDAKELER
jgi:RNA polymerase sigma factor (sigma-70 family)